MEFNIIQLKIHGDQAGEKMVMLELEDKYQDKQLKVFVVFYK